MILMHKNTPVAEVQLIGNTIVNFTKIYNQGELPLGTYNKTLGTNMNLVKSWVATRTIPNGRPGTERIFQKMNMKISDVFIKSMGLSITDTYWLKEKESPLTWEDVNFHRNGFYSVFAQSYFSDTLQFEKSPDFTTDGEMEKFWIAINDKAHLCKKDNHYHNTQIANEVFVYKLCSLLDIPCTPYYKSEIKNTYLCMTPNFVKDEDTDYFNAMQIMHEDFSRTGENLLLYIQNKMGFQKEIEQMKYIDLLTKQQDRHAKNIGFTRKGDDISFVPLFDNGNCLGFNEIKCNNEYKTFNKRFNDLTEELIFIPDVNETDILKVLKDVYEDFEIEEKYFEIAKDEIVDSNQRILTIKGKYYIHDETEMEM